MVKFASHRLQGIAGRSNKECLVSIFEGMWNGFDFYLDRIYSIFRLFFACGEGLSAEGRIILTILRAGA